MTDTVAAAGLTHATLYELHANLRTLGMRLCHANAPRCDICPLQTQCQYAQRTLHGRPEPPPHQPADPVDAVAPTSQARGTAVVADGDTPEEMAGVRESSTGKLITATAAAATVVAPGCDDEAQWEFKAWLPNAVVETTDDSSSSRSADTDPNQDPAADDGVILRTFKGLRLSRVFPERSPSSTANSNNHDHRTSFLAKNSSTIVSCCVVWICIDGSILEHHHIRVRWKIIRTVMRASKMYENMSHAWLRNY